MFFRMIRGTFTKQLGKMLLIAFTIALGASLATAMINVMMDVGNKVNAELKTYGANITVSPKGASILSDLYGVEEGTGDDEFLSEEALPKLKTIFWSYNIVDFTPYLKGRVTLDESDVMLVGTWFDHHMETPSGESLDTGMREMKTWWDIEGEWLTDDDDDECMVGIGAAQKYGIAAGDTITVNKGGSSAEYTVKAVFDTGSDEDDYIYTTLKAAQELFGRQGLISSIEVSALTTPDNELSKRAAQDPQSLSAADWETWYCTAYVSAICYQIEEAIPDCSAKAIRQVADSEGAILEKIQLLMILITALALIGSALGIMNLVAASVMERSQEIGLLKAVGAHDIQVIGLVLTEIMLTAVLGGVLGYIAGIGLAQIIGMTVFSSSIAITPVSMPLVAVLVLFVALIGSIPAIRMLVKMNPTEVLHSN